MFGLNINYVRSSNYGRGGRNGTPSSSSLEHLASRLFGLLFIVYSRLCVYKWKNAKQGGGTGATVYPTFTIIFFSTV